MIKVLVLGRLGSDPVDGKDFKGTDVTTFSLAGQGPKAEETTWFDCIVYGKTRDVVKNYVKKGSRLFVEGRLFTIAGTKGKKMYLSVNGVNLIDPKQEKEPEKQEEDGSDPF